MSSFAVLLRAVNLGGSTRVPMATFRAALEGWGYERVETILQSGNAVLRSPTGTAAAIERRLDREGPARLGVPTTFFVRSADDWRRIVAANPFPREAAADPAHLVVVFLKTAAPPGAWARLREAISGRERATGHRTEGYIVYPDGIGRSRLTPSIVERALETRVTARNWTTVQRIAARLAA